MNIESIVCRKRNFGKTVEDGGLEKAGDFCFNDDFTYICIWLPGSSSPDAIPIQQGVPGGARIWGWDGNLELPTIVPSILAPNRWHGYLTNGELKSC